ncbi:MAG TPA: SDR family NAD(P)-dependent oxidoreductase [Gammaproteobacteria bacterium]|nr:SDR family NAD(P)-dependent oxidoreductase [Gammaproteobacteria bacterium]
MKFTGQHVLITGASRGIGRAIAMAFAAEGARVAVHYRSNAKAADDTLAALPGSGHINIAADVSDPADCERLVREATERLGGLDVLINNAGIFETRPVLDQNYAEWQAGWHKTLTANLDGPANLCFLAAHYMAAHGGGRIVNISSRGAFRGEPVAPAYGASKAGLNALSQSLAVALAPHNIFVGVVAPGFVATDMTEAHLNGPQGEAIRAQSPLNRVAGADEIAKAVLFLADPELPSVTGAIIDVNGASYLRS